VILYSVLVNRGGLLRVFESLKLLFNYLDEQTPLRVIYFSESPLEELDPNRFIHINWKEGDFDALKDEGIIKSKQEIESKLDITKVKRIICDSTTYKYFEDIPADFTYDIHILERTLFKSLKECPASYQKLDEFINDKSFTLMMQIGLVGINIENQILNRADHLLVNSKTSIKDLHKDYSDIIDKKTVYQIPVSSKLNFKAKDRHNIKRKQILYQGRLHPQKGLHFLLDKDWGFCPLTIKGLDQKLINSLDIEKYKNKGITFEPWSSDSKNFQDTLENISFMIFPSIYEPYGLALQEALHLGKICICHDNNSGHNEQVIDGENGFLIDMAQNHLINKVQSILNKSDEDLIRISDNAINSVTISEDDRLKKLASYIESIS